MYKIQYHKLFKLTIEFSWANIYLFKSHEYWFSIILFTCEHTHKHMNMIEEEDEYFVWVVGMSDSKKKNYIQFLDGTFGNCNQLNKTFYFL